MVEGVKAFEQSKIPNIHFGKGKIDELPAMLSQTEGRILLVVSKSFSDSESSLKLYKKLEKSNISFETEKVTGEPSPELIDGITDRYRNRNISAVVGIGGGSAVDSGKAISAMFAEDGSVADYLEGVGTRNHSGKKLPYIAVPTTSGTGSEATKNAVISRVGTNGFKKSLRHDNFVPDHTVVDPELTVSCSPESTAACGLDALTQLLEAYTSTNSSQFTDALSVSGLKKIKDGFEQAFYDGGNIKARESMSYAALLSGIVLANAGLGVVHGFASPIGGFFQIPHGVVCGTLLGASVKVNLDVLFEDMQSNIEVIEKYSIAGEILSGRSAKSVEHGCSLLIDTLDSFIRSTGIKKLHDYGIDESDFDKIISKTGCKYNPARLEYSHLRNILNDRL